MIIVRYGNGYAMLSEHKKPIQMKHFDGRLIRDYHFPGYVHPSVITAWNTMRKKGLDKLDKFRFEIYKATREEIADPIDKNPRV